MSKRPSEESAIQPPTSAPNRYDSGLLNAPTEFLRYRFRGTGVSTGKSEEEAWLEEDDEDEEEGEINKKSIPDGEIINEKNKDANEVVPENELADGKEDPFEEFMKSIQDELKAPKRDFHKIEEERFDSSESESELDKAQRAKKRQKQNVNVSDDEEPSDDRGTQIGSKSNLNEKINKLIKLKTAKSFVPAGSGEPTDSSPQLTGTALLGITERISIKPVETAAATSQTKWESLLLSSQQQTAESVGEKICLFQPQDSSIVTQQQQQQPQQQVSLNTRFSSTSSTSSFSSSTSSVVATISSLRKCLQLKVLGLAVPRPYVSFSEWKIQPLCSPQLTPLAASQLTENKYKGSLLPKEQRMQLNQIIHSFNLYLGAFQNSRISPSAISSQLFSALLSNRDICLVSSHFETSPFLHSDRLNVPLPFTFTSKSLKLSHSKLTAAVDAGQWDVILWQSVLSAFSTPRSSVTINIPQPFSLIITSSSSVTSLIEYRFLHLFGSSDLQTEELLLSYVTCLETDDSPPLQPSAPVYVGSALSFLNYVNQSGLSFNSIFSQVSFLAIIDCLAVTQSLSDELALQALHRLILCCQPNRQLLLTSHHPVLATVSGFVSQTANPINEIKDHLETVSDSDSQQSISNSVDHQQTIYESQTPLRSVASCLDFVLNLRSLTKKAITIQPLNKSDSLIEVLTRGEIDVRFVVNMKRNSPKLNWFSSESISVFLKYGDVLITVADDNRSIKVKDFISSLSAPFCKSIIVINEQTALSAAQLWLSKQPQKSIIICSWSCLKLLGSLQFRTVVQVDVPPVDWLLSQIASTFSGTGLLPQVFTEAQKNLPPPSSLAAKLAAETAEGLSRCYVLMHVGEDDDSAVSIVKNCIDLPELDSVMRKKIESALGEVVELALTNAKYRQYKLKGGPLVSRLSKTALTGTASRSGQLGDALTYGTSSSVKDNKPVQYVQPDYDSSSSEDEEKEDSSSRSQIDPVPVLSSRIGFGHRLDTPSENEIAKVKMKETEKGKESSVLLDPAARLARKKDNLSKFKSLLQVEDQNQ